MAVALVSGTEFTSTSSGFTSLTINKPASVADGDVLVAVITCDGTTPTAPSNWVKFGGGLHPSASWNNGLYYKIVTNAAGEPSAYTWTTGSTGPAAGLMAAWRGVDLSSPIAGIQEESVTTSIEPNTGPSLTVTGALGRLMYVRAVRESVTDNTAAAADLTTATSGVTRRASGIVGNKSASSNTAYTTVLFSNDSNYSGVSSYPGLAISNNRTEASNYEATYALRASTEGTLSSSVDVPTASFTGTAPEVYGTLAGSIDIPTMAFVGAASPPEGTLGASVTVPTLAFAGAVAAGGALAATLSVPTASFAGGVDSIGPLAGTIDLPVLAFVAETTPFGAQVIRVEAEKRAFRVIDAEPGLIAIYPREVTQQ